MKNAIRSTLFLALAAITFASCKKDSSANNYDRLTNGDSKKWTLTSETRQDGTPVTPQPCDLDNSITISRSGTINVDFGTQKCSQSEMPLSGSWTLEGEEKVISAYFSVLGFPINQKFNIVELTDTKLTVKAQDTTFTSNIQTYMAN